MSRGSTEKFYSSAEETEELPQPGQEHYVRSGDFEARSEHRNDSRIPEELSTEMFNSKLNEMSHFC